MSASNNTRTLSRPSLLERLRMSGKWLEVLIVVGLAVFSFMMVYPFLWLVFSSFKTASDMVKLPVHLLPERWTLSAYTMVWTRTNLPRAYFNSLFVSTATVFLVLFTSSLGGFVFARLDFPGRKIL